MIIVYIKSINHYKYINISCFNLIVHVNCYFHYAYLQKIFCIFLINWNLFIKDESQCVGKKILRIFINCLSKTHSRDIMCNGKSNIWYTVQIINNDLQVTVYFAVVAGTDSKNPRCSMLLITSPSADGGGDYSSFESTSSVS